MLLRNFACSFLIFFTILFQFPLHACKDSLKKAASDASLPWGSGKVLLLKDMKAYCELHDLKFEVTYAAWHYGRAQRANPETIAAVKKKKADIMKRIERVDKIMDDLDFDTPEYKRRYKELKKLSGEHQLQGESLEMMEWAAAWQYAYNKQEVISTYALEERYPVDIPGRPYPPLAASAE